MPRFYLTQNLRPDLGHTPTPVGHVRLFGRSASVDSGGSVPAAVFVDFSLSRAANCDGVSVPRARRLMRHHARLRAASGTYSRAASGAGSRATFSANGREATTRHIAKNNLLCKKGTISNKKMGHRHKNTVGTEG